MQALRAEQCDAVANEVRWEDRGPRGDDAPDFCRGKGYRHGFYGGKLGGKYKDYNLQPKDASFRAPMEPLS